MISTRCRMWIAGVGTAIVFASANVGAAPLNYVESTDLGNTNTSGPTIGPLDVGVNTVSGSVFREASPPTGGLGGGDYGDFWETDLATGLQITAVELVLSNVTAALRGFASDVVIGGFDPGSYQAFIQESISGTYALTTTPSGTFRSGAYPFPADHYYFGVGVLGTSTGGGADYEWRVTVGQVTTTVPEPTTMPVVVLWPGEDFVAESTSFKASHNTSAASIQRSSVVSLLAGSGSRVASRFQRGRAAAVLRELQVPVGAAAGEDETSWRAWSDISVRQSEDQLSSTAFKSDIEQIVIGADTFASEKLLLGALVSYERDDVETRFNRGSQDIDQYQLAGYAGYLFNSSVSVDATFGYATLNINQDRLQPLSGRVKSKVDSSRWFGAANVNGFLEAGAFLIDVSTGIIYAKDKTDDFTESNGLHNSVPTVRLGIWRAGASVTYPTGPFEIFGNAFFVYDFKRTPIVVGPLQEQPDDDRTELQFAVGARYTVSDRVSAALEYSTVRGKANFESDTFSLNVNIEF